MKKLIELSGKESQELSSKLSLVREKHSQAMQLELDKVEKDFYFQVESDREHSKIALDKKQVYEQ